MNKDSDVNKTVREQVTAELTSYIFGMVPPEVFFDPRLTDETRRVLGTLYTFRNRDTSLANPSLFKIQIRCGLHKVNISSATSKLVDLGWLEKSGNPGKSKSLTYKLIVPECVTQAMHEYAELMVSAKNDHRPLPSISEVNVCGDGCKSKPVKTEGLAQSANSIDKLAQSANHYPQKVAESANYKPDRLAQSANSELAQSANSIEQTNRTESNALTVIQRIVEKGDSKGEFLQVAIAPPAQEKEPKATRLPRDWELPIEWFRWAMAEQPTWTDTYIYKVADGFRDYWIAKPGKDALKADWAATWRNWVRRQGVMPAGRSSQSQTKLTKSHDSIVSWTATKQGKHS